MKLSALLVLVCCLSAGGAQARDKAKPRASCKADAECVAVPDGCCGCDAGGKQRAIPARERAAHERARQRQCKDTMCAAVMSNDPSCSARPVCKEGACVLAP